MMQADYELELSLKSVKRPCLKLTKLTEKQDMQLMGDSLLRNIVYRFINFKIILMRYLEIPLLKTDDLR